MNRLGTGMVLSIFFSILLMMIIFASLLFLGVCHYIRTKGENFIDREAVPCLDIG